MDNLLVTNNPMVLEKLNSSYAIKFIDVYCYIDVLTCVRDLVHKGHTLLTHPLSGSIKPNETPYKSIIVSKEISTLDMKSLSIIEHSIATYLKFTKNKPTPIYIDKVLLDFQLIDFDIINSL